MASIECKSAQPGVPPLWLEVMGITDGEVAKARAKLDALLEYEGPSDAVAIAFVDVTEMCPEANPSDLWQHVIYRHLLDRGWNDNKWKRVSGFALERAFVRIYKPRLAPHGLRMKKFTDRDANSFLTTKNVNVRATKIDLFLEGNVKEDWHVFGAAHVKASIAERIQDDVPASLAFMNANMISIALTLDAKSYPPPHGDCINYGELGGRSIGIEKDRLKRSYIEESGQFDGLFSFNLRTPSSREDTLSGKRIYTMSLSENQPDQLVRFLKERWQSYHIHLI